MSGQESSTGAGQTKKKIIMPLCWPRFIDHYGHFMRDRVLYLFYYLDKKGMLDDPNVKILYGGNTLKNIQPSCFKAWSRMPPSFMTFMSNVFGAKGYNGSVQFKKMMSQQNDPDVIMCAWPRWKTDLQPGEGEPGDEDVNGSGPKDGWGGDTAYWPKITVDKFRDYCFKKYNFTPELKDRVLYVPRKPSTIRHLDDKPFETELQQWCAANNFEFLKWHNDKEVSVFDQMKIYSESKIIVGVAGSDFANSYWTSEDNLMIEILYPRFGSGFCAAFYIDDETCKSLNYTWEQKFKGLKNAIVWPPARKRVHLPPRRGYYWADGGRQKRLWKHVYLPEENVVPFEWLGGVDKGRANRKRMFTGQQNRDTIIKLMDDHVSH